MSIYSAPATKEEAAQAVSALGRYISLHQGSPGTTGANEAAGGTPVYARKQTTWTVGTDDGIVTGSEVTVDVPAGTYDHFGIWSLVSGGVYVDGGTIPSTVMSAQGQIKVIPVWNAV